MLGLPTYATLLLLTALPKAVLSSPCLAMDANFNLLALGLNGKDWNAGTQDSWSSSSGAKDITADGRPPFDGTNTTCYLAQFYNAVYVLNGDKTNPSDVYIYDAGQSKWSTQKTDLGKFDPTNANAILDHDTNVFYALNDAGELFFLNMNDLTAAQNDALSWTDVQGAPWAKDGYKPVMALAENHVHFIGVPGLDAGQAYIFVIHFSFFQPDAQTYSGATFPATHGQTTSLFQTSAVQQEFAFIPDDGSATYIINVENNSTAQLAAPTKKDPAAQYFAGITSIVQLASDGTVSYLPYTQGQDNSQAQWSTVQNIAAVAPASSSAAGASGTAAAKSGSGASKTGTSTAQTGSSSQSASGGLVSREVKGGFVGAALLGLAALLL